MHAGVTRHVLACMSGCVSWATGSGAVVVHPAFAQLAKAVQADRALLESVKCPISKILVADLANPEMPLLMVEIICHRDKIMPEVLVRHVIHVCTVVPFVEI